MRYGRRFAGWLATTMAAVAMATTGPADGRAGTPLDLAAELQSVLKLGVPGGIAAAHVDGVALRAAAGTADLGSGRPVSGDETFRIASITKLATGMVVQRLLRTGQIAIEDKLGWHLPRIVPEASRISLRHLLEHTAGVPDYLGGRSVPFNVSAAQLQASLVRRRPRAQLIRDAAIAARKAQPGAAHDYSNTHYVLIEALIEKVTGKSFRDVVEAEIIEPLALRNTGFPDRLGRMPGPSLHGYVPGDGPKGPFTNRGRPLDVTEHDYFAGGDGGLYSTAGDLDKLLVALASGSLLGPDALPTMLAELREDHDGSYRYGLGVMVFPTVCGEQVIGHVGRDIGTFSGAFVAREGRRRLVVAFNAAPDYVPELDAAVASLKDKVFCD